MSEFDHAQRSAPIIPSDTCPEINRVIETLDKASDQLTDLIHAKGPLEQLRKDNELLREGGIYWRDQAKEMSERIAQLEDELSDMTDQRDRLQVELDAPK